MAGNKVVASLAPQDTDTCLRELEHLAARIGLAEVRLDLMASFDVDKLVAASPVPLVLTCRPERERGAVRVVAVRDAADRVTEDLSGDTRPHETRRQRIGS